MAKKLRNCETALIDECVPHERAVKINRRVCLGKVSHATATKSRFASALMAGLLLVGLAAGGALAQEKKNIRMVFVSLAWNSEIPFRAALARGYFKQQGLQIEPILIRGGPAAISALISGEVDFASIGGAQAIFRGKSRGLDLAIIGCISGTTNYILLGNKQTRSIEDLKGKPIGITGAGTYSEFAVRAFLKKNNINPDKDVVLRSIGGTVLRAAAIEKGIIAAAPFSPEDAVRLMRAGYVLISNMNDSLGIPQNILVTSNEVLNKYPETSKRMLKAYIQGMQLAKFNKTRSDQSRVRCRPAGRSGYRQCGLGSLFAGLASRLIASPCRASSKCSTKTFAPGWLTRTLPSIA